MCQASQGISPSLPRCEEVWGSVHPSGSRLLLVGAQFMGADPCERKGTKLGCLLPR